MSWRWISKQALLLMFYEILAEHGGNYGLAVESSLDSILAGPVNLAEHEEPDAAALAASYGVGVAKNHPFVDGNKRAALLAAGFFLYLNGFRLQATQADTTLTMLGVAAGDVSEEAFAAWLRSHIVAREKA
jgi:death-on-curing protein